MIHLDTIKEIFGVVSEIIDVIGAVILVYGFTKSLIKYLLIEFSHKPNQTPVNKLKLIRSELGSYILLALDFLIVSDLISTILEISQSQLIQLGAIVFIRTIIAYFLGKEIEGMPKSE